MDWTLTSLIQHVTTIIGTTIPVAVGLCLLFFMWGLFQMFGDAADAGKRKEGQSKLLWSILALFVVVSLWGIVQILRNTLLGQF